MYAPAASLIEGLAERLDRAMDWELVRSGGQLYVNTRGTTLEGALSPYSLAP